MLTVTGLARRSGTTAHAVRYYTRMGLLRPERDPDNGYRLYKPRMALQKRMEQALLEWADKPDGAPDGHSVCHLIDSIHAAESGKEQGESHVE